MGPAGGRRILTYEWDTERVCPETKLACDAGARRLVADRDFQVLRFALSKSTVMKRTSERAMTFAHCFCWQDEAIHS